jgi:hypothetical protein
MRILESRMRTRMRRKECARSRFTPAPPPLVPTVHHRPVVMINIIPSFPFPSLMSKACLLRYATTLRMGRGEKEAEDVMWGRRVREG